MERYSLLDVHIPANNDRGALIGADGRPQAHLRARSETHVAHDAGEFLDLGVADSRLDQVGVEGRLRIGPYPDQGLIALLLVELDVALGELRVAVEHLPLELLLRPNYFRQSLSLLLGRYLHPWGHERIFGYPHVIKEGPSGDQAPFS